jgi:hypothetical protein
VAPLLAVPIFYKMGLLTLLIEPIKSLNGKLWAITETSSPIPEPTPEPIPESITEPARMYCNVEETTLGRYTTKPTPKITPEPTAKPAWMYCNVENTSFGGRR